MSRAAAKPATTAHNTSGGGGQTWRDRVEAVDWSAVRAGLDRYGCALTGPLLTPREAAGTAALYPDDARFRSTVNMSQYRFGEGEYRYFTEPFPAAVTELRQALYPKLLPIARDWWARLGRQRITRSQRPMPLGDVVRAILRIVGE
jgi:uncharacterized protein